MSAVALWVGGYPATEIAPHTPPTWETLADGGTGAISWSFELTPRSQHPALRPGSIVEVRVGSIPVARGALIDPDRTSWDCHAYGLQTERWLALDGGGNSTRDLNVAITNAIARGWRVSNPTVIGSGLVLAGDDSGVLTMQQLFSQLCVQQGGWRWGVRPDGRLYFGPDPTSPWWSAAPDTAVLGVTEEGTVTHLAGRYDDGTPPYKTTIRPEGDTTPRHEETADLTKKGTLTLAQAKTILDGALKELGKTGFTNGVTLTRSQLTTVGGTDAFLPGVSAVQTTMRAHGLISARASLQTPWLDFVVGKTAYTADQDYIYVEPVKLAARTLTDVLADM